MFVVSWLYNRDFKVQIEKSLKKHEMFSFFMFLFQLPYSLLFFWFPNRSPHYACPEVIRVRHFLMILIISIFFGSTSFYFLVLHSILTHQNTNTLTNTLFSLGREVWREESRRLELWGHSFCPVGGECHLFFLLTDGDWTDIQFTILPSSIGIT